MLLAHLGDRSAGFQNLRQAADFATAISRVWHKSHYIVKMQKLWAQFLILPLYCAWQRRRLLVETGFRGRLLVSFLKSLCRAAQCFIVNTRGIVYLVTITKRAWLNPKLVHIMRAFLYYRFSIADIGSALRNKQRSCIILYKIFASRLVWQLHHLYFHNLFSFQHTL